MLFSASIQLNLSELSTYKMLQTQFFCKIQGYNHKDVRLSILLIVFLYGCEADR